VQVQLLGGVNATINGVEVDVGPPKCQTVLAALALADGKAVPVSRIIDLVWGEEAPRTADKTLQSYITRLRKGLGPESIERVGSAYRLCVEPESVDAVRFAHRIQAAEFQQALEIWAGPPLAGLDAPGLANQVDSLTEQWLGAIEQDLQERVDVDPQSAISQLTTLTGDYPFREGLWALQMSALYRLGRQADALAAYQQARHHLIDGLGVEPGPRLQELEAAILGHEDQLIAPQSAASFPSGVVSFVFCEIVDGARLWSHRSPAKAEALALHSSAVLDQALAHDGHVFAESGESVGVAFHRATDAVAWVQAMQQALAAMAWPENLDVRCSFGLHAGEAEERNGDYFGSTVNLTAQLAAAAHPGQALLSSVAGALAATSGVLDLGVVTIDGNDHRLSQLGRAAFPPLGQEVSGQGNLPRRLSPLIGRDDDVERISKQLENGPLVTLVGPGGIGKTQLALEVARQHSARCQVQSLVVELASTSSGDEVVRAVAEVLDVQAHPSRSILDLVVSSLESRAVLLVLDNCEHVIAGAAELADELVARCSSVAVLATSREGLGVQHEQLTIVTPLPPAAGVELFNARALAASPEFDVEGERASVTEICQKLDGVPLAIELAAVRTVMLSPTQLVDRLDNHLRLLSGGRRGSVERHRTLRATIQWSFDLLTPAHQALLRRLSTFAGPFDLEAVERIVEDGEDDVEGLVEGLVSQSLVMVDSGPFGRRLRLLETMRQFAAEELGRSGETDEVAARHASWCAERVEFIGELLVGLDEVEGVNRLSELWPNLRAAFEWTCAGGDYQLAHRMLRPIATEIGMRASLELGGWAERVLAMTPHSDVDRTARAVAWIAQRYMLNRDVATFEALAAPYRDLGHPLVEHAIAFVRDDDVEILKYAPAAIHWLLEHGDINAASHYEFSSQLGPLLALGQFDELTVAADKRLAHHRQHGPPTFTYWTLFCMGFAEMLQGNGEAADAYIIEAATIEVPERTLSVSRPFEARLELAKGNHAKAVRSLRDYSRELIETDNIMVARLITSEFVNLMGALGKLKPAAVMIGYIATTGAWGQMSLQNILADTVELVEADPSLVALRDGSELADDRAALNYMESNLAKLLGEVH